MPQLPPCHICGGQLFEVSGYPVAHQVTSDCRPWQGDTRLAVCAACGTVQKPISANWLREVQEIYAGYAVYDQGGGVEQASFDQNTGASIARSQKIVHWLQSKGTLSKTGSLLDIGCGNGAFLRAFGSCNPGWKMEGLELDTRNKALIEAIPGVTKFHVGPIDSLNTRFDLIVLIHALEHIPDPINYLRSLAGLLNTGGQLLIEVPDLQMSPFDLLIADHCTHFSADALNRIVGLADFEAIQLDAGCVTKELTLLAGRSTLPKKSNNVAPELDDGVTVRTHIEWLHTLLEQGQRAPGAIGIFGTSISGTWLAAALGGKVQFFVDEDVNRIGRSQLDRPIHSPENAPKDVEILMPLRADIASAVAQRLSQFKLQFTIPPASSNAPKESRMTKETKEKQYGVVFDVVDKHGISRLGLMTNESWNQDPKRTLFTLARYKFVAKMLAGTERVLEIGCADAFGTRLVQQSVSKVTAIDFDPIFIDDVKSRYDPTWPMECFVHDLLEGPVPGKFDAIYSLDVLEHINPENERQFVSNMISSLDQTGVVIIGMPSLESQAHASPQSKVGHVNCKSGTDLKELFKLYFHNVFLFSMNDEMVHTGFSPMAHYVIVLCCGKINGNQK